MKNLLPTDVQEEDGDEDWPIQFPDRVKCFDFNKVLDSMLEDYGCDHCTKYLTLQCPHISKFLEDFNEGEE